MLSEQEQIGNLIKQARKKKKSTQEDLADKLEVSQDTISSYEKGKIKVIPFEKRIKLASILEIPLSDLLYEDENKSFESLKTLNQIISVMAHHEGRNMTELENFSKELRAKIAENLYYTSDICGRIEKIKLLTQELQALVEKDNFDIDFPKNNSIRNLTEIIEILTDIRNKLRSL